MDSSFECRLIYYDYGIRYYLGITVAELEGTVFTTSESYNGNDGGIYFGTNTILSVTGTNAFEYLTAANKGALYFDGSSSSLIDSSSMTKLKFLSNTTVLLPHSNGVL